MSEANTESSLSGDDEAFEPDQEQNLANDEEENVEVHEVPESKEDVLRRKKIRRQLERKLEQKRLREELDDFIDLDDKTDDESLDDDFYDEDEK